MVDHGNLQGALGVDDIGGVDQLHGGAGADDAGHALGAAEAGDDAQTDLRLTELGLFGSHANVAGQGHFTAAAQGEAVHCGDGGLGEHVHSHEDAVAQLGEGQTLFHAHGSHLADVGAGDEGTAGTGDDHNIHVLVMLHLVQSLGQIRKHCLAQGVQSLRTVHGDNTDMILLGDFY